MFPITRTTRTTRAARIRPHILRRDGVLEAPGEIPHRSRYGEALAVGWRPLA